MTRTGAGHDGTVDGGDLSVLQLTNSTRPFFENQLTALERQGVSVTQLCVPGSYDSRSPRSVTEYARYYPSVLRESLADYDLVHANFGLVVPFALAQPTRPVVLTLWGSDLMGERAWLRRLSRFGARTADTVVLPSERMADELDVAHDVVPFGIDTDRFRPIPQGEARERVGWDRDSRYVLFPYNRERPEKDFARAKAVVDATSVDAELVELVELHGVDHAEMPYYYNASDALLVTSKRESGPMVVKEAAACNVPVVSTDVGFVDRVLDGVDGTVVSDSNDELVAGLESVCSEGICSNGRTALDGLGIDEMGERLVAVYRRVLDERVTRSASRAPGSAIE